LWEQPLPNFRNLMSGDSGVSLVEVENSALFNSANSEDLSRGSMSGTATTWTASFWVYRGVQGGATAKFMFTTSSDGGLAFASNSTADILSWYSGSYTSTTVLYRDVGWYHIVVKSVSGSGTVYVNGEAVLSSLTVNGADATMAIGSYNNGSNHFDGYMAEWVFIDGTAYNPTSFAEYDETGLYWTPKSSDDIKALTFGNNGFYLDNTTNAQTDAHLPAPAVVLPTVTFDGTNDYLTRGADYTGNADSKLFSMSMWVKRTGGEGALQLIHRDGSSSVNSIDFNTANKFHIVNDSVLDVTSARTITISDGWTHIMCAYNNGTATFQLYIDGVVDSASVAVHNNANTNWTHSDHAFGGTVGGANLLNAEIADFYFNNAETIDLSSSSNRAKFITTDGYPVDLGSDGSTPTGTAPRVYLNNALATWHTNLGTGGGFTENGALTAGSSILFTPTVTSTGGGGGGKYNTAGVAGGSGGGGGGASGAGGAASSPTQGFAGGTGGASQPSGGGGGGAGVAGVAGGNAATAGDGGNGLSSSINFTATVRGGGGGSGSYGTGNNVAIGGTGGGADGVYAGGGGGGSYANGLNATANTGGGGGGSSGGESPPSVGGTGGSGVVIVRYHSSNEFTEATGGTVTYSGDYAIHTFTASGTLSVVNVGVVAPTIDYLVIAGGGGATRGGGGAGGYRASWNSESSGGGASSETGITPTVTDYTVTIGAGGAGASGGAATGSSGANSVFGSITSTSGGAGGNSANGLAGGSGGGGGVNGTSGGAGTTNQGFAGGNGTLVGGVGIAAGGGGGASAVGAAGTSAAGNGGAGLASTITGSSVTRAGGGGGGTDSGSISAGSGGSGGGGAGGALATPTAGTVNTGSGGGGTDTGRTGGAGGSGVVIIRYKYK
jgi:hypothetical protein